MAESRRDSLERTDCFERNSPIHVFLDGSKLFKPAFDEPERPAYSPAMDGLRFLAFAMVFLHHAPQIGSSAVSEAIKLRGWIGVDLFFTLSAYLLLRNLRHEHRTHNTIDVGRFYLRRLLRIYPLLVVYVTMMLWLYGPINPDWQWRLAGLLLFFDNIISWFRNFNGSIAASAHLWTLSYEFQYYLAIPFLFMATNHFRARTIVLGLTATVTVAAFLRLLSQSMDVGHPFVYVTPLLRPESLLAGALLAFIKPAWAPSTSLKMAVGFGVITILLPMPWADPLAALVQYPIVAAFCASLLDAAIRHETTARALSNPAVTFLGTISYGLYVYHFFARHALREVWTTYSLKSTLPGWNDLLFSVMMLAMTLALAVPSYFLIERPFLKMKLSLGRRAL